MTDTPTNTTPTVDEEGVKLFADHYTDPIIKLAVDAYVGSLLLHYQAHPMPMGSTEVTISATKAIPEDTPSGFVASNLLEEVLMGNLDGFTRKLDFPIEYTRVDLWAGLAKNTVALPARYDAFDFRVVGSQTKDPRGLRLELLSKKLNRAVYFDISTPS